ncbi:hypothetical protein AALA22_10630 [Anaerovoracaceae bacterium 41-7]|uniref:hypothetical protein n=1 Tax=Emergencia sp. JLR.KK010 TaxID=3114296 RepID=UPI0030D5B63D
MKYYGVTTKFYDDGKIKAEMFEVEADKMPVVDYQETNACDIWRDYFTTYAEAESFLKEMLNL